MEKELGQTKRIYCNQCRCDSNHVRRCSHSRRDGEEDGYWELRIWTLWTCAGCDTGTLEVAETGAGLQDAGEDVFVFECFPPRAAAHHAKKSFRKLPKALRGIYRETVDAFNAGLDILAAGGLRALMEGICSDKGITGKTLEHRINGLESILPKSIVANLHAFRFMGNEALHALGRPERTSLITAIDVSEDLLNFLYELDYKASRLPTKGQAPKKVP